MLLKFGGIVADGRGSIGGVTFSRNRAGAYAKQRTVPVNPNSPRQAVVRTLKRKVSQDWYANTTAAQKAQWALFGSNVVRKNKLDESIHLTGFMEYDKANMTRQYAGLLAVSDGPAVFTLPGADPTFAVVVSEASQDIAVTFDASLDWAIADGGALLIRMGSPKNDSIEFFNGPWRNTDPILGAVVPPVTGDVVPVPFPVVAGQKIWAEAKIVEVDGRVSSWFRTTIIVSA